MALEVLVVDDEADIRDLVSGVLEDEGYSVRTAADSTAALDAIDDRRPSMVLLDVWLQGSRLDGLQLLQEIKRRDASLPVLVISGHGTSTPPSPRARRGYRLHRKAIRGRAVWSTGDRATETDALRRENATCASSLARRRPAERRLGRNQHRAGDFEAGFAPTGRGADQRPRRGRQGNRGADDPQWSPAPKRVIVLSAAMMSPDRFEEESFGLEVDGIARPGLLEQAHGGRSSSTRSPTCRWTTQGKICAC